MHSRGKIPPFLIIAGSLVVLPSMAVGQAADQFGRHHPLRSDGYTVVDFSASWCEPCYEALPRLEKLASEHPGVRFLVVSVDEETAGRDRLVSDLGLDLPVIWDDGHELVGRFRPRGFPATYVLDAAGEVIYEHVGTGRKKWRALVDLLGSLHSPAGEEDPARTAAVEIP